MWASVAREIVKGVEEGTRPGSAGSSSASSAAASMSRQGSNMTTSTTTASTSTAPMPSNGSSGKLFAGNKVPPTVQEEAVATPQRTATPPATSSAPAAGASSSSSAAARPSSPVKRKPLPTFGGAPGVSNSPMPSPWDSPQQQRRPPLTPVTRTVGGSSSSASGGILRTPGQGSTPMQQQRSAMALGSAGVGMGSRPTLPTRPQSELFTPVRKGSVAFGQQQQGTPRRG